MFEITEDMLETVKAKAGAQPIENLVKLYTQVREAKVEIEKETENRLKSYVNLLGILSNEMLARAHEEGVTSFKTPFGTAYTSEQTHASIDDDAAFYAFVRETGDLEFFERKVKVSHVKEYIKGTGALPPGLSTYRTLTVKVRKS
jgi:hypothetical protein